MKINFKILLAVVVAAASAQGLQAKSFKRGVSENQFALAGMMSPIAPGVSWYYNWGSTAGAGYHNEVIDFPDMEYVPMCWNGVNADAIREYCAKYHPKYLLGFNEPNFTDQANLTPAAAAAKWPEVKALADELGLMLVAPALNYSPNAPYQDPVKWMDEFVAIVGKDAFDFTAIHNYGGLGVMKDLAGKFHDRYGKPVWVTEFCLWPGGAGNVYVSPAAQTASMIETVEWLETTEWIYRYAWFKCVGAHNDSNKPNYGLEISINGQGVRELSPQGWVYIYMSEFDMDRYYTVEETVAATDYVSSKSVMLARGANTACPRPIEISQFNGGASADYLFDVPADGIYSLILEVSGAGEPTRFDPMLTVYSVDADGENPVEVAKASKFAISGNDDVYTEHTIEVSLKAGRQRLRLADSNPFQPSGIHISTLRLADNAGVSDIMVDTAADGAVYTLQGIKVREAGEDRGSLPRGIYIVNGRKVLKR